MKGLGKIVAFQRSEGSGSQTALKRLMGDTPLTEAPKERTVNSMEGIVEKTGEYRNFKNALGYSFLYYCREMARSDTIKLLKLDGVAPTAENVRNGSYPQTSSFYAVTRADADENTLRLLEWIAGPQGQSLVEKTGYVGNPS